MTSAIRQQSQFAHFVDDASLLRDGFCLIRQFLDSADQEALRSAVTVDLRESDSASANRRGLLDRCQAVAELAASSIIKKRLNQLSPGKWRAVRAVLFDKTPGANWHVRWHQDQTIAVKQRLETDGFNGWSEKQGVCHVQAPAVVLEQMLSVRVHLDAAGGENGALKVVAGSHAKGKLEMADRETAKLEGNEVVCEAGAGDALIMRPLILHASATAKRPSHRRVLHVDYSCGELPGGLEWHWSL